MTKYLNEEDLRPNVLMKQKEYALQADRAFLLERKDEWVEVSCPACGESRYEVYGEKHGFVYVTCQTCATIYMCPRPGEDLLATFHKQSLNYAHWSKHIFPATEKIRKEKIHRPRAAHLERLCRSQNIGGGHFLEVGAAYGNFCEEVRDLEFFDSITALEPTPDLAQILRDKGFQVAETIVERFKSEQAYDVIAAYEVIEHLTDPAAFIRQCGKLLRPGGLLVISCPNSKGFDVITLGVRSGCFQHGHLNYFHPDSMRLLFSANGLDMLLVDTPGALDADIVHRAALRGEIDLKSQPLLQRVLIDDWESLGARFQEFLSQNSLSSHMVCVGRQKQ